MKHLLFLLLMIPVTVFGQSQENPIVFFDEPGAVTNFKEFKILQPLAQSYALAMTLSNDRLKMYLGPVVLLHQADKYFYDEEIIKTPEKSVERQIGIYRYETREGLEKTVPIIEFEDIKSLKSGSVSSETNKKRTKTIKVNSSIADEVNTINDYIRKHPDKEDKVKYLLNGIVEQLK